MSDQLRIYFGRLKQARLRSAQPVETDKERNKQVVNVVYAYLILLSVKLEFPVFFWFLTFRQFFKFIESTS